jgi:hypothetical protein
MNLVMTGMIPVMLILGTMWPGSEQPLNAEFWFRMSLATIVGGILAFPVNYWLVANHLKHGCMTLPEADKPAAGLGHTSPEPSMMMDHGQMQHAGMQHGGHDTTGSGGHEGHAMTMKDLPFGQAAVRVALSFAVLIVAVWLTNLVVPVKFWPAFG